MRRIAFYLGIGFLFAHELDAVVNHEWRVLPLTSWLSDEIAKVVFIMLHVPIFACVVAIISSENVATKRRSMFWISIFLVVHGILHAVFTIHPKHEFESLHSHVLIYGGAACGLIYLLLNKKASKHITTW